MDKKNQVSRRDALKTFSVAAGAAAVPPWMAGCGEDDSAKTPTADPRTGPLVRDEVPIDTVVCVMMENRSFDHYFGALSLEEGRTDVEGLSADMYNEGDDGKKYHPVNGQRMCVEDPPHQFPDFPIQVAPNAAGHNGGFVRAHIDRGHGFGGTPDVLPETAMEYHNREQLPFLYNLADDFTLCQKWFASFMGGTWTNRWYLHGAQSRGETANNFDGIMAGTYDFEMIYDRLVEKGLTFKYYYSDAPFLALSPRFVNKFGVAHIRPIREFYEDAASGNLPNYAMVDPGYALNDDHPPHHVSLGQQFMSSIYHSLAESPHWERSMLFITYDEHGGFFDHLPPPMVAHQTEAEKASGIDQLGFRVPSLVAGPYVKHKVSDTQYEHTSVLAFLEWLFDIEPLTLRDANANNFVDDVLDVERIRNLNPRTAPIYPEVEVLDSYMLSACHYWSNEPVVTNDVHLAFDMGLAPAAFDLRPYRLQTLREVQRVERERAARLLLRS